MLSLLLDEHLSPAIARQLTGARPGLLVTSMHTWRTGALLGAEDRTLLQTAAQDGKTLVTYDLKTIPPLLAEWSRAGVLHGGVIFVDQRTLAPNNFGGLVRALLLLWETQHAREWTNRVVFLQAA